jgi:hypothetical protein
MQLKLSRMELIWRRRAPRSLWIAQLHGCRQRPPPTRQTSKSLSATSKHHQSCGKHLNRCLPRQSEANLVRLGRRRSRYILAPLSGGPTVAESRHPAGRVTHSLEPERKVAVAKGRNMKYTKPEVANTYDACHSIQIGTDPTAKGVPIILDTAVPRMFSTTSAYEADE